MPDPPGDAWNLVTIGDSIPYGQYDCGGCDTFTTIFARAITDATGMPVTGHNLSTHDNLTGARLLDRLGTSTPYQMAIADADFIIVTIGHNDTPWNSGDDSCDGENGDAPDWSKYTGACVEALADRHGQELDQVLTAVQALRGDRPTAIRVTTDYNDVIGWDQAPPEASKPSREVLDAFASETCRVAAAHHVPCIDVYHSFNGPKGRAAAGDLLGPDYTHPSASGQARIATLLSQAGLAPLQ